MLSYYCRVRVRVRVRGSDLSIEKNAFLLLYAPDTKAFFSIERSLPLQVMKSLGLELDSGFGSLYRS